MTEYRSWIPTQLEWTVSPARFGFRIPAGSEDLVATLASGTISVIARSSQVAECIARLKNGCVEAACYRWLVRCDGPWGDETKQFFLYDVLQISLKELFLVIGDSPPKGPVTPKLRALTQEAADRMERFRREQERQRKQLDEKLSDLEHSTDPADQILKGMLDAFGSPDAPPPVPPRLLDLSLRPEHGSLVSSVPVAGRERNEALLRSVAASDWAPSRDGTYRCALVPIVDGSEAAYLLWTPREALTPALEIKSALERKLKSALSKPRRRGCTPPRPEQISGNEDVVRGVLANADEIPDQNELSDFLPRPTGEGREGIKKYGFEAIAWYQQFHCYDEASWGIHLHSPKLDEFVADLASDLRRTEARSHQVAALVGVQLIVAHELFHAQVEFAAAWHELSGRRRRYLRYFDHVYTRSRFAPDWLEEALANWSSHEWLVENLDRLHSDGIVQNPTRLRSVVEDWLDFSPAGYREWRAGDDHVPWDRLASEIAKGEPSGHGFKGNALPLGGLLRRDTLFDLRLDDIPVYFVGKGVVASIYFGSPSRREVAQVLRHFDYGVLSDRGKGSHEVWKGRDGRTFTVPARDPLSIGVFHSLLEHFGWSKQQYMQEIRAKI